MPSKWTKRFVATGAKPPEEETQMPKQYVFIEDEVKRLKVCERTFRKWLRQGLIPSYRPSSRRILLVPEETDAAMESRFRREAPQPA